MGLVKYVSSLLKSTPQANGKRRRDSLDLPGDIVDEQGGNIRQRLDFGDGRGERWAPACELAPTPHVRLPAATVSLPRARVPALSRAAYAEPFMEEERRRSQYGASGKGREVMPTPSAQHAATTSRGWRWSHVGGRPPLATPRRRPSVAASGSSFASTPSTSLAGAAPPPTAPLVDMDVPDSVALEEYRARVSRANRDRGWSASLRGGKEAWATFPYVAVSSSATFALAGALRPAGPSGYVATTLAQLGGGDDGRLFSPAPTVPANSAPTSPGHVTSTRSSFDPSMRRFLEAADLTKAEAAEASEALLRVLPSRGSGRAPRETIDAEAGPALVAPGPVSVPTAPTSPPAWVTASPAGTGAKPLVEELVREAEALRARLSQLQLGRTLQALYATGLLPDPRSVAALPRDAILRYLRHIRAGSSRRILSQHERSGISISGKDFATLRPETWINDEVVNLTLSLLQERDSRARGRETAAGQASEGGAALPGEGLLRGWGGEKVSADKQGEAMALYKRLGEAGGRHSAGGDAEPARASDTAHGALPAVWPATHLSVADEPGWDPEDVPILRLLERRPSGRRAGGGLARTTRASLAPPSPPPPPYPRAHFFSTYFLNKLYKDGGRYDYAAVRRWTATNRLKIVGQASGCVLDCDLLLFPVHEGVHWTAACVDLRAKTLAYYDSMGGENPECLEMIARWVVDEFQNKKDADRADVLSWPRLFPKSAPRQLNGSDCGMFMLAALEHLSRGAPLDYAQCHVGYFRVKCANGLLKLRID